MELPWLYMPCHDPTCKRCDCSTIKCECGAVFCFEHFTQHAKNCGRKVGPGRSPSETKKAVRCDFPGCKTTSYVPMVCDKCRGCFCVAHRHIGECTLDEFARKVEREKMAVVREQFDKAKSVVDSEVWLCSSCFVNN